MGRQPAEGDIAWDRQRAAQCMRWTLCAGIVAGLVGVGGGMLLGPLMLQMGVLPQVSAATTGTMILTLTRTRTRTRTRIRTLTLTR